MKILAIETSCDETAIAILECEGDTADARFRVLGNALLSQIDIHKEYGGVFPALAKREHAKNLVPLLEAALEEAKLDHESVQEVPEALREELSALLSREPELGDALLTFLRETERPDIDAIAVTHGPGLEPALWVGVNFARALSSAWDIPLVPVNHMEGHLLAALAEQTENSEQKTEIRIRDVRLPVLALLISGGHTELVLMKEWLSYELIGQTRDDAVGEAYDKVARMMGLPYPGGPEVSKLAERARLQPTPYPLSPAFVLPRPMLDSGDLDFSFSGLKTAVLYLLKEKGELSELEKGQLARAFEDAVAEVLWKKTAKAIEETGAKTLVIGGGVSANTHIQRTFRANIEAYPATAPSSNARPARPEAALRDIELRIPAPEFTTDNAVMIGIAGYYRALRKEFGKETRADGTLSLA